MHINCAQYDPGKLYFLLIQTVIPRPIAWILSDNGNGTYNLAPFSFFNAVSADPPVLMISAGFKPDGPRKDTWENIDKRGDFVVHIPSVDQSEVMVATSAALPHGESEVTQMNVALVKEQGWCLPRVKGAKAAFLCEKFAIHEIGNAQALILGKINHIWLDDGILTQDKGRLTVDPKALNPVARLGGSLYAALGQILTLRRPEN